MAHHSPPYRDAAEYWESAAEGRFTLPYCEGCETFLPPTSAGRGHDPVSYREPEDDPTLVVATAVRHPVPPVSEDEVPYVAAIAEVAGVRIFTRLLEGDGTDLDGADPDQLPDDPDLSIVFRETDDGRALPCLALERE